MSKNYPSDWNSRRKKVYRRDDYICQNCGSKGGPKGTTELHAHHIVPVSRGGSHEMSNLSTVCNQCHMAIHNEGKMARAETREEVNIDPSDYEGTEKGVILLSLRLDKFGELSGDLQKSWETINKYSAMLFKHVDEPGDEVPDKLATAYIKSRLHFRDIIKELRKQLSFARELTIEYNFPHEYMESVSSVIQSYQTYVQSADELREAHEKIATVHNNDMSLYVTSSECIEWDVDVRIAANKVEEVTQEVQKTVDNAVKQTEKVLGV